MNNGITTATHHLIFNRGKDIMPYLCYDILHDCVCSKRVFKCCSPMYEGWFEGFPPLTGVGHTCCPMRKGKWGETVLHFLGTTATRRCLQSDWNWLKNIDSGHLLNVVRSHIAIRWIELTQFPWTVTVGFFMLWAALTDLTGSSSSNSPLAYSSGSWSTTASLDDAFRAENSEHKSLFYITKHLFQRTWDHFQLPFHMFVWPSREKPSLILLGMFLDDWATGIWES